MVLMHDNNKNSRGNALVQTYCHAKLGLLDKVRVVNWVILKRHHETSQNIILNKNDDRIHKSAHVTVP